MIQENKTHNPELLICSCSSVEHQIIFTKDKSENYNVVYCNIHLSHISFFKRLIAGIKYIFGYKCKYGNFQEFILDNSNVDKLQEIVEFIKEK